MSSGERRAFEPVSRHGGQAILTICGLVLLCSVVVLVSEWQNMTDGGLGFFPPNPQNGFWPIVLSFVGLFVIGSLSVSLLVHRRFGSVGLAVAQAVVLSGLAATSPQPSLAYAGLYLMGLLLLLVGYRPLVSLATATVTGIAVVVLQRVSDHREAANYLLGVIAIAVPAVSWIRLEAREWQRQSGIYSQARWAASEFITVNVRMQDSIDRIAGTTRMRERVRVAREIHDTVGYTLTAVLMQVQAAQEVYRAQPGELPVRLTRLEAMVRESIQDVRREVSTLRDESVVARSGNIRWSRLCGAFADGTGIRVHYVMSDDLEQVSPPLSETVYRILQETLTNAYRHGGADYVDVRMAWDRDPGRILLRVSDNGRGTDAVVPGNGLTGMRERVAELAGEIEWRTAGGQGFDLGVVLPWKGFEDE